MIADLAWAVSVQRTHSSEVRAFLEAVLDTMEDEARFARLRDNEIANIASACLVGGDEVQLSPPCAPAFRGFIFSTSYMRNRRCGSRHAASSAEETSVSAVPACYRPSRCLRPRALPASVWGPANEASAVAVGGGCL